MSEGTPENPGDTLLFSDVVANKILKWFDPFVESLAFRCLYFVRLHPGPNPIAKYRFTWIKVGAVVTLIIAPR